MDTKVLYFRNSSFLMFQPREADGKVPHLLLGPKWEEASRRTVACARKRSSKL